MRIVLDTNVLLPSIRRDGESYWLFRAVVEGELTLVVSTSILLEYEEVITRRTTPSISHSVITGAACLAERRVRRSGLSVAPGNRRSRRRQVRGCLLGRRCTPACDSRCAFRRTFSPRLSPGAGCDRSPVAGYAERYEVIAVSPDRGRPTSNETNALRNSNCRRGRALRLLARVDWSRLPKHRRLVVDPIVS